ncbi:MAG: efflux transporter outer membrane subunit [Deltaproteobacteria bacterium]|nr:efflux transporter outer membrane subunit [Deltaproteobacteria bacterium]MBF0524097.1 efflux transporter outer membrane subunit [Deltaproteobacteria bacterium]
MKKALIFLASCLFLTGCTVGPDYKRPGYPMPEAFRGVGPTIASQPVTMTFGELRWFELFKDDKLKELIQAALKANYDVRIAVERILQARATVVSTRSSLFPAVTSTYYYQYQRASDVGLSPSIPPQTTDNFAYGSLSWELDFWGRIRRSTEAARANLFASEENRKAAIQSLVTDLAQAYFELRELDLELEISKSTLDSRMKSLQLVKARQQRGVDTMLAVRQSEGLVYAAAATIPNLESQIEQKENQICVLLGRNPGPIERGKPLTDQGLVVRVPAGLPSSLLERRPDILAAEQNLVAANAQVGVAKAALFPTISLTASAGYESTALSNFISNPASTWTVVPNLTMPIFNAGKLSANLTLAEAKKQEALLQYQQTIQKAFSEAANTLIGYRKIGEYRIQQELYTKTLEDQTRLSRLRYRGGVTTYLELLDSERQYFTAEIALAQVRRDELLSVVSLYKALGGGWQE